MSILAVLKLGACYIPIDVSYPIERVKYIAQNSSCKKILTNTKLEDLDNLCLGISLPNATTIYENKYKPDLQDLAYIIYTSGSTGNPKGVKTEVTVKSKEIEEYKGKLVVSPFTYSLFAHII